MKIPTFSGDKTAYRTWKAAFSVCVEQQDLSPELKLLQLRQCLTGSALKAIESYGYSAAAYTAAIRRLEQKFGGDRRQTAVHTEALARLPVIRMERAAQDLEKFADLLQVAVIHLEDAGHSQELQAGAFYQQLLKKLPQSLLTQYYRQMTERGEAETVCTLLAWALREADYRTTAQETLTGITTQPEGTGTRNKQTYREQPTAAALAAFTSPASASCVFCGQSHEKARCSVVTNTEKRKDIVKSNGRCFLCLKPNHIIRHCQSKLKCAKCQRRHHTTLCDSTSDRPSPVTPPTSRYEKKPAANNQSRAASAPSKKGPTNPSASSVTLSSVSALTSSSKNNSMVLLQTAKAIVAPSIPMRDNGIPVRVLFDGGSQRSFVTRDVQRRLDLKTGRQECLKVNAFGEGSGGDSGLRDVVNLTVQSTEGDPPRLECVVIEAICAAVQNQHPAQAVHCCGALQGLTLADDSDGTATIDLLIGADQYWQFMMGKTITTAAGPTAIHTRLGWVLSGPASGTTSTTGTCLATEVHSLTAQVLDQQLQQFWELESLGIHPITENQVQAAFNETVTFEEGRYTVRLPWKEVHATLPDNFRISNKRLMSLTLKLEKTPSVFNEYARVMREQLAAGIIEEVKDPECGDVGNVHYVPHQAVVREDKTTTKVRVVYDASSRSGKGPSINTCLNAGPNLLEKIPDILMRFRCHAIALTGDIEKAFHILRVGEDDRDVLRFLWWDDPFSTNRQIKVFRFARVMFGLTSSPFLLNATLKHHLDKYQVDDPDFVSVVGDSMYVDDLAAGADDEESAVTLYSKLKERMGDGGFNIRKFASSSISVQQHINTAEKSALVTCSISPQEDDLTYAKTSLNSSENDKVLGVKWNRVHDELVVDIAAIFAKPSTRMTKRAVSSEAARIFDPLGLVSPVTIKLKLFLQQLHVAGFDWDTPLSPQLAQEWTALVNSLQNASPLRVPRRYCSSTISSGRVSLHRFCDASQTANGAVVYLKVESDEVAVQLVMAKTRVAPTAKQTIPRLELLSALILARLMATVRQALEKMILISSVHCWTDSQVALGWITNEDQEWKQFVQNRVDEIHRLTGTGAWGFCPGTLNPADLPSRGTTPAELHRSMWLTGPAWLHTANRPPGQ